MKNDLIDIKNTRLIVSFLLLMFASIDQSYASPGIKDQSKPEISLSIDRSLQCGKVIIRMFKTNVSQDLTFAEMKIARAPYDYEFANGEYLMMTSSPNPAGSGTAPRMIFADTVDFKSGGKYLVKITARSSGEEAGTFNETIVYDTIHAATQVQALVRDTIVCKYSSITIEGRAAWGSGPYSYRWYRNNTLGRPVNLPSYLVNRSFLASDTVQTKYIFRVADAFGCFSMDTMTLYIKPAYKPMIQGQQTGVLVNTEYNYSVRAQPGSSYKWNIMNGSFISPDTIPDVRVNWPVIGNAKLLVEQTFHGCTAWDSINLTVGSTGLSETKIIENLSISPNPNNGSFLIKLDAKSQSHAQIKLYDALGSVVLKTDKDLVEGKNEIKVETFLPSGIYLVVIEEAGASILQKVLINHR